MKKQSFVYGALVLLVASFLNRIIGFAYQIIMVRLIKSEGIGLFNMVFPVYVMILVLATVGIPLAIAKLVSEEIARHNFNEAYRIFYICLTLLTILGILFTGGSILIAPLLSIYYFPNPKVHYIFLALIPGIFLVSLCSAFRGFFQGLQQMTPTAVTQILEQLIRVSAGLLIAYLLLPKGIEYAAIGISLGVVFGELTGLLSILIIYLYARPPRTHQNNKPVRFQGLKGYFQRIFSIGIPVTLSRFVATALMSIEAILIPQRFQAGGMSLQQATAAYGLLVGVSQTLLLTPGIITASLATALIPSVADATAQNNLNLVRFRTAEAIRLTNISGLPCVVLFLCLPVELCKLLFGYPEAGESLVIMAIGGPFLYFTQTTTGILQGMGETMRPFKNLVIASSFKIIAIYFFTSFVNWGVQGIAIAITLFFITLAYFNYLDLKKTIAFRLHFLNSILKPVFAAVIMGGVVWYIKTNIFAVTQSLTCSVFSAIFLGVLAYMIALWIIGGILPHDIQKIKTAYQKILPK